MNYAMILLAGDGRRMHTQTPKQFLRVRNIPVFIYTTSTFNGHPDISGIVLVVHPDYIEEVDKTIKAFHLEKIVAIVSGGKTRQESVRHGLEALKNIANEADIIVIHDAARPLVSDQIITNNVAIALQKDACETVLPMSDTVITSIHGEYLETPLNRNHVFQVQTPQSFRYKIITNAHKQAEISQKNDLTDDAQAVNALGIPVHLVMGSHLNFKITNPDDFALFEAWVEKHGRHSDG